MTTRAMEEIFALDEERGDGDGDSSSRSTRSCSSDESFNIKSFPCMIIVDTDADGDQIMVADDEKGGIFRTTNPPEQPDIESATCGSTPPTHARTSDKCNAGIKYPGIPANGSFDTADTEDCATLDGSEASTDAGEINSRPSAGGGEGDCYEDNEEREEDATSFSSSSSQRRAKDIILQRLQMARDKLNNMMNWCEFGFQMVKHGPLLLQHVALCPPYEIPPTRISLLHFYVVDAISLSEINRRRICGALVFDGGGGHSMRCVWQSRRGGDTSLCGRTFDYGFDLLVAAGFASC